jgi:hypothetical protein
MTLNYRKPAPQGKAAKEGKPLNNLQMLASKENFAIFQLKGMQGNIIHMWSVLSDEAFSKIVVAIDEAIKEIKHTQQERKERRSKK